MRLPIRLLVMLAVSLALALPAAAYYVNDGAAQNSTGGWTVDKGYCTQTASGDTRADCRSLIVSSTYAPDPLYDTQTECTTAGYEWTAGPNCTNYWYNTSQAMCETTGTGHGALGHWTTNICRGLWRWTVAPPASSAANYRENCLRCHNDKYYAHEEIHIQDTYLMTGHKNMARPVVPTSQTYYTAGYPWAGSNGVPYASDGTNTFLWSTGQINIAGVPKSLYWIYDGWVASNPSAIYDKGDGGNSYSCGRCHTTGWTSDATLQTTKDPERTFPGISWEATANPTGKVKLASGITGDTNPYSSWDQWGIQCSRCHGSQNVTTPTDLRHHPNMTGKEATGTLATGATKIALCMDCHRQETGGLPYDSGNTPYVLKVGMNHGTELAFLSHATGNQVLNSPHGRFTGTSAQINLKANYDTFFKNEGESYPYSGNQGGCTQCHNVHKSTNASANPAGEAIHEECTACHAKNLANLLHPGGVGTPIENMATDPAESCESCHMPGGMHLFRINSDASYTTFPVAALTGTTNANMAPEGTYASAVWVDMDYACGQCHGGGTAQVVTTGGITTGTKILTVPSVTGFAPGNKVEIAGAGAAGAALENWVVSVNGALNQVTLAANASTTVANAHVVQGPTANGAGYMTRSQLATLAKGIHNDAPFVSFVYSLGNPNTQVVNLDASATMCSGSNANCDAFAWDCGVDGTFAAAVGDARGVMGTCTYTTAGAKTITLEVEEYGVNGGSTSRTVNTYAYVAAPVVGGSCSFGDGTTENTWTVTITDASTSASKVTVAWGDNSALSTDLSSPFGPFSHTYTTPGTYTVTHKAYNSRGESSTETCQGALGYFQIAGTVYRTGGVLPLAYATIEVKRGATFTGTTVRTVGTTANGTYTITNLAPGAYSLRARKNGFTFSDVLNFTIGPNGTVNFTATGGGKTGTGKPLAQ